MSTETASTAQTLVELLRQQAARHGDRVAFRFCPDGDREQDSLTYRELDLRARAIAASLQQLGVAGQRILLTALPGLDTIPAFFGCLYAGASAVPVDDDPARVTTIIPDADPDCILVTTETRHRLERAVADLGDGRPRKWCVTDDVVRDAHSWARRWTAPAVDENSIVMLEYTSGSTGTPRGTLLSHRNVLSNIEAQHQVWGGDEQTVMLSWVGLQRNTGLIAATVHPVYLGCSAIVVPPLNFFARPMDWLKAISRHRATVTVAYSRVYPMCVKDATAADIAALDLSCLVTAIAGGEPISATNARAFIDTFAAAGFRPEAFAHSYGMAQATLTVTGGSASRTPIVCSLNRAALRGNRVVDAASDDPFPFDVVSCGQPIPEVRIAIVDPETLRECGGDEVGEVWIAGPNVTQGYWRRPEETARTFAAFLAGSGEGPFLRSGDLGFLRAGELFLTGRWSDLLTIDNGTHYPGDIEETVQNTHPVLVAGRGAAFTVQPDRHAAEQLVIVQEVSGHQHLGRPELAGLIDKVRSQVAGRHRIEVHDVVLVKPGRIPTASGKVRRGECRRQFVNGALPAVAEWHAAPVDGADFESSESHESPDRATAFRQALGKAIKRRVAANRLKQRSLMVDPKHVYPVTTRLFESADVVFLNYGYQEDPPLDLPLDADDEPNRPGIQLYHQTATQIDLEGKDILEVSCGHGGGASYLVRTFQPASYTAVDVNAAGIEFCQRRHRLPGLDFVRGDAQALPFPDQSFDAVVNVEASHGYPDFEGFLAEVARVLRSGGSLLYADLRGRAEIPAWEAALAAAPLRVVSQRGINDQALRGLRLNSRRYLELIESRVPAQQHNYYREFSAVQGTQMYRFLERGVRSYRIYRLVKD